MSFDFAVRSSVRDYQVIGPVDLAARLTPRDVVVVDPQVADIATKSLDQARVVVAPEGESNKTLGGVERVIIDCNNTGLTRGGRIVAVGGGMTQDLVTAAASLYMRGVPWVLVPTTWLSIMDSCIGGKSAINVGSVKNLAGNFNPPDEIWVDLSLTGSLPEAARAGGLAEAVKIAYCAGPDSLATFMALWRAWDASQSDDAAYATVEFVLRAKAGFVERDEFDRGERLLLNLGHTFAHALEVATDHVVSHGQAVALGVIAASALSSEQVPTMLVESCIDLARAFEPCRPAEVDWTAFDRAIQKDKKHTTDELRLIVPGATVPTIEAFPRTPATVSRVRECMVEALVRSYGE